MPSTIPFTESLKYRLNETLLHMAIAIGGVLMRIGLVKYARRYMLPLVDAALNRCEIIARRNGQKDK